MQRLAILLLIITTALASGCTAWKYGWTLKKAHNNYMNVAKEENTLGYKRLQYNIKLRGQHSALRQIVLDKGMPDYIYEYQDEKKRDGIILFYTKIDSAYLFEEQKANDLHSSRFVQSRQIFYQERKVFQNQSKRRTSRDIPLVKYSHHPVQIEVEYVDDSLQVKLKNPIYTPVRMTLSSKTTGLDSLLQDFNPVLLESMVDTTLMLAYQNNSSVTVNAHSKYGHLDQEVDHVKFSLPFKEGKKMNIIEGYNKDYDYNKYAIRFDLDYQDTIYAAESGYVVGVIEEYHQSGNTPKWKDFDNSIIVYHPESGVYTQYGHLIHKGSLVKLNDRVEEGEPIGLAGKTGYAPKVQLNFLTLVPWKDGLRPVKTQFKEGYCGNDLKTGKTVENGEFSVPYQKNEQELKRPKTLTINDFKWKITIPENFNKISKQEWRDLQSTGAAMIEESQGQNVVNKTELIFMFRKNQHNYVEALHQPFNQENADYRNYFNKNNRILYQTLKNQVSVGSLDSTTSKQILDGLAFHTFKMKIKYKSGRSLTIHRFTRVFVNKEFNVNIIYMDDKLGQRMLKAWQNSTFK